MTAVDFRRCVMARGLETVFALLWRIGRYKKVKSKVKLFYSAPES